MMQISSTNWEKLKKQCWSLGVVLLVILSLFGRATLAKSSSPTRLVVYAFSAQEEALSDGIFPAFQHYWKEETGQSVTFESVFGPSGSLAGQINLGAPADVAVFSSQQHAAWLQVGRQVDRDTQPVAIGSTPMVIVLRPGITTNVTNLADLASSNLNLIHADPRSSGAGEWAVLAEYGSAFLESSSEVKAYTQLDAIWQNVQYLAPSAREMMNRFEAGNGDALLTYEQEALLAKDRGVPLEIVVPPCTIVAEPVAVLVDSNVAAAEKPAAQAFIQFVAGDQGQAILQAYHLRSVDGDFDRFQPIETPFTVTDLGGWAQTYKLIDEHWQKEIEPELGQWETGAN